MTSGKPLTEAEKKYIVANKDALFPGEIAKDLGRCRRAVRHYIRTVEEQT